ncbi:MAG TPA: pilus assembly protein N-terminal domain-containing protein [Anaeromyxobacter sp.]
MRAALIALLAAAAPASAAVPLALAERQVVTLEFQQPVARIATTDPDLFQISPAGGRVTVTALRAGRATLDVTFADGATVVYDVTVDSARRLSPRSTTPNEIALGVGEERRFRAPGVARVLVEENGVARVGVEGETVAVVGLAQGQASLVLVDGAGAKTGWQIRVR